MKAVRRLELGAWAVICCSAPAAIGAPVAVPDSLPPLATATAPAAVAAPDDLAFTNRPAMPGTIAMSFTGGQFGADPIYNMRLAYYPKTWLGLEATITHNPSSNTHAALHHAGASVRVPGVWRLQPFAAAGLGTIHVFPGNALNATSVTKLLLHAGGGAHFFLRDDVALRFEGRSFAILDQQESHRGTYGYAEWSAGLAFFRSLFAPEPSETGAEP